MVLCAYDAGCLRRYGTELASHNCPAPPDDRQLVRVQVVQSKGHLLLMLARVIHTAWCAADCYRIHRWIQ